MADENKQAQTNTQSKNGASALVQTQNHFLADVQEMANNSQITLDEYAKTCVITAISAAYNVLLEKGNDFKGIDNGKFLASLQGVALHKLNLANGELFVDYHKGYGGKKDTLTFAIQGNGWESIVNRFGQGVKKENRSALSHYWAVREGDEFTLPSFNGFEIEPPKWQPKFDSTKKVIYIVYGLKREDDSIEWLIRDRESVKANLIAHVINSGRSFFRNNPKQQEAFYQYAESKKLDELLDLGNNGIDECFHIVRNDQTPVWISPAWTSPSSREPMIIRKMRNNALKQYPLDFDNTAYRTSLQAIDSDLDQSIYQADEPKTEEDKPALADFEIAEVDNKELEGKGE